VVTASFSWLLPVGRGRKILGSAHGLGDAALGGWQFSGTGFFASGSPITIIAADTNLNLGESQKPNRIGRGIPDEIPRMRRGVDYPWFVLEDFVHTPSCISAAKGCPADQYGFKPFVYGNSGRNLLDGPGLAYMNAAMSKNFRLGESKSIQARVEVFNALNHPNFMLPNNQFNGLTAGLITASVGDGGRGSARVFQSGLKFVF